MSDCRLMTKQEAKDFRGDAWFEIKRTNLLRLICTLGHDYKTNVRWNDYGRTFRVWTDKPTEEQRKAEPWTP